MYKIVFSHLVAPGKKEAVKTLLQERISRAPKDSPYASAKRYFTVTGQMTEFVLEVELESLSAEPEVWDDVEFQQLTVPGSANTKVLKEIEFDR